jgi:protease-4
MELMTGVETPTKSGKGDKIAIVYAVGPIMEAESSENRMFESEAVTSEVIIKAIRQAESDSSVKGIVLRVDSPGGSALASDLIWRDVVKAKKPVVASMGNTAASGGYYISMGADKILAEPGTLTGSIGVVGGKLAIKGLLTKIGVTTEVIGRGKNSGVWSMTEPFTATERETWKRLMGDIYRQFTSKAAEGRKMDLAKLESLAGGRIFSGRMAVANGLVDKLGTLDDAVVEAKLLAGLKADDKVDLLILPKPKNFFEQLFEGSQVEAELRIVPGEIMLPSEILPAVRAMSDWQRLFKRPINAVLPFHVDFN